MVRLKKIRNFILPCIGQGAGGEDSYDDDHRVRVLRYGIDLGMTLIDTAESYGNGRSEEVVGKAIKGIREKVFIATKFSPEHSRYPDMKLSLEKSLKRLGTEYVDLYQAHWPNPAIPIEETVKALLGLRDSGKIRHIGVSNFGIDKLLCAQKASHFQIESDQIEYNLLERGMGEEVLSYAKENNLMVMAYSPLRRSSKGEEVLKKIALRYQRTPAQIILSWLIAHDNLIPIPKTLDLEHVKENALSSELCLEKKDFDDLGNAFKPQLLELSAHSIRVLPSEREKVYTTLDEAIENRFDLHPDIKIIAEDIKRNTILKPVHVVLTADTSGRFKYDLVQGRMRYWAWVYVYGNDRPIRAYLKE